MYQISPKNIDRFSIYWTFTFVSFLGQRHLEAIVWHPKSVADIARKAVLPPRYNDGFSIRFKNRYVSADVTNSKGAFKCIRPKCISLQPVSAGQWSLFGYLNSKLMSRWDGHFNLCPDTIKSCPQFNVTQGDWDKLSRFLFFVIYSLPKWMILFMRLWFGVWTDRVVFCACNGMARKPTYHWFVY